MEHVGTRIDTMSVVIYCDRDPWMDMVYIYIYIIIISTTALLLPLRQLTKFSFYINLHIYIYTHTCWNTCSICTNRGWPAWVEMIIIIILIVEEIVNASPLLHLPLSRFESTVYPTLMEQNKIWLMLTSATSFN
jgi:hypothetical protein